MIRPLLFVAAIALAAHAQAADQWACPGWNERLHVTFNDSRADKGAEIAVVRMRPEMNRRSDPYDIRAFDDSGSTLPVRVLYWHPDGEMTCLIGISTATLRTGRVPDVDLYLGNPEADPVCLGYEWRSPMILLGSRLKRIFRRHGEWRWENNDLFGSVHIGIDTSSPPKRDGHSVTGLDRISCHPRRMRVVQMVWIDPAAPPRAIAIDFLFDNQILSAYWTDNEALPDDIMPNTSPTRIGPLPKAGRWHRLETTTAQLRLEKRNNLRGIGFSNHGGLVKWGPTALGAMPVYGDVASRQMLALQDDGTTRPVEVALRPASQGPGMQPENVRFDLTEAPLFVEPDKPLAFTLLASSSFRFTGEMQDCPVQVAAIASTPSGEHTERILRSTTAVFPGGDNWQRAVQLQPDEWTGASRIEGRLVLDGTTTPTAALRLLSPGYVPGLRANGTLLEVGSDAVTFVIPPISRMHFPPPAADARISSLTIVFTDLLGDLPEDPTRVSINSNDPHTGLEPQALFGARRTPAEWIVAAARASASGHFGQARLRIGPHLADIGLALSDTPLFMRGIVCLLRQDPDMRVAMQLAPLRQAHLSARGRALMAACLAVAPLLETSAESPPPDAAE